jgi:integrase
VVWDLHIATTDLALLYVDDIREDDVRKWLADLRVKEYVPGKGKAASRKTRSDRSKPRCYSRATIRGYYRVLRTILTAAGASDACKVGRLKGGKRKANYLRHDELQRVHAHVGANAPEWYPAVLLDAFAGLRWGELSALKWEDIDEARGMIEVRRGARSRS